MIKFIKFKIITETQIYLLNKNIQTINNTMSVQIQSPQSTDLSINNTPVFKIDKQPIIQIEKPNKRSKFIIDPRLSILPSSIDPSKSKLQIYKQHLLNIQLRKSAIPHVPEPSIISYFNTLKSQKSLQNKKEQLKKQIILKRQEYQKLKKTLEKYNEIYDSKEQSMKEKLLLSKILSTKLESQFDKTRQKFRQLEFAKIINLSQKKLYFYQLAQIFFNDRTRNLFSLEKQISRTDEQMGICLGYLGFIIENVSKIAGVQMWMKFKFKGPRSTITILDPKMVENFSNTSIQGSSNLVIMEKTFLLHPKQTRLNQALLLIFQQLKQIMKYNLGLQVGKSKNFYQLCQELSKFLLNV